MHSSSSDNTSMLPKVTTVPLEGTGRVLPAWSVARRDKISSAVMPGGTSKLSAVSWVAVAA